MEIYLLLLLVCILTAVVIYDRIVFKKHRGKFFNEIRILHDKFNHLEERSNARLKDLESDLKHLKYDVVSFESKSTSLNNIYTAVLNDIKMLKQPVKFQIDQKVNFKIGNDVYKSGKIAYCQRHHSGNLYSILHKNNRYRGIPEKDIY